jgi:hypothetical protein
MRASDTSGQGEQQDDGPYRASDCLGSSEHELRRFDDGDGISIAADTHGCHVDQLRRHVNQQLEIQGVLEPV